MHAENYLYHRTDKRILHVHTVNPHIQFVQVSLDLTLEMGVCMYIMIDASYLPFQTLYDMLMC